MPNDPVTLTLPFLTWQGLYALIASLGVAAAAGLVWLMLSQTEHKDTPVTETLGKALAWVLMPVWVCLLGATLWGLWQVFNGMPSPLAGGSLGLGALIAAMLGAPFVIHGTWLRHKTNRLEQEGHMTDRINKAIEQLGAEKTIKEPDAEGKTVERTVPNIEVRIGAILSLERIAQDSTIHDNGRDHVRVMEILCAYIRENAPAAETSTYPFSRLNMEADYSERYEYSNEIMNWINTLKDPREDISIALKVLGMRGINQILVERLHKDHLGEPFRINLRKTCLRRANLVGMNFENAIFFKSQFEGAYCNDTNFSYSNLEGAQFIRASIARANLSHAKLASTDFTNAIMTSVDLTDCVFAFTHFVNTQLIDARITYRPEGPAPANRAFFFRCNFRGAIIEGDLSEGFYLDHCSIALVAFRSAALPLELAYQATVATTFGDATVDLYPQLPRPEHWPDWQLPDIGPNSFEEQWRKWQANPDTYTPPEKPD